MKTRISLFFVCCFLSLLFLFHSCKNPTTNHSGDYHLPNEPGTGFGKISVCYEESANDAAPRTAFPHADFDSFRTIFFSVDTADTIEQTPDDDGYYTLPVGTYTVELQCFRGDDTDATLVAAGVSPPFTVHEGDNDPVVVCLSPVLNATHGTFTYTVSYPLGAATVITLQQYPNMQSCTLNPAPIANGYGMTQTLELDIGTYLLTINSILNGRTAGTSEAIHIYPLLPTHYTKVFNDNDYSAETPPIVEPPPVHPLNIMYYWLDIHDSLITTNNTTIAAGEPLTITTYGTDFTNRQWYVNGVATHESGETFIFSKTIAGNYTIGLFVTKGVKLYNTNIIITVEPAINTRTITIDMFDSGGNGWGGSGAIRLNVNGVDIATNIKVHATAAENNPPTQKDSNTYTFTANIGDVVSLYWVYGSVQTDNSFIVYYADIPPNPAFNASSNSLWNGTNALVFKNRGSMNNQSNGSLLGSFTVCP